MKALTLAVLFLAVSAQASHYKCSESAADALKARRHQYSVFLTSIKTLAKNTQGYDLIERVRVSILSRDPHTKNQFKLARNTFEAVAKSADVMYSISSPSHGFSLGIYMDELDQSWMKLNTVGGTIRLNCGN